MEPRTLIVGKTLTQAEPEALLKIPTGWIASLTITGTFGGATATAKIVNIDGECPLKTPAGVVWSATEADTLHIRIFPGDNLKITLADATETTEVKARAFSKSF